MCAQVASLILESRNCRDPDSRNPNSRDPENLSRSRDPDGLDYMGRAGYIADVVWLDLGVSIGALLHIIRWPSAP